jgi:hypothetical protein
MASATAGIWTRRSRGREEKKSMMNLLGHGVKTLEAGLSGKARGDWGAPRAEVAQGDGCEVNNHAAGRGNRRDEVQSEINAEQQVHDQIAARNSVSVSSDPPTRGTLPQSPGVSEVCSTVFVAAAAKADDDAGREEEEGVEDEEDHAQVPALAEGMLVVHNVPARSMCDVWLTARETRRRKKRGLGFRKKRGLGFSKKRGAAPRYFQRAVSINIFVPRINVIVAESKQHVLPTGFRYGRKRKQKPFVFWEMLGALGLK